MAMVTGAAATRVLVLQTLGDLSQNPFNPNGISLGDQTFKVQTAVRPAITGILKRLSALIMVDTVSDTMDGDRRMISIDFTDRETKSKERIDV